MRIPEITHPDDRQQDWELFQRVVRGEAPDYRLEKRYVRKDGSIAWVNVNMTVIRDAAGQPLRTMATIEDISERKRAEEEIRRLNAELEQRVLDRTAELRRQPRSRRLFLLRLARPARAAPGHQRLRQHPAGRSRGATRFRGPADLGGHRQRGRAAGTVDR